MERPPPSPASQPRSWPFAIAASHLALRTLTLFLWLACLPTPARSKPRRTAYPKPLKPPPSSTRLREVRLNPPDGQPYVWIPPGVFRMGCSPGDQECFDEEKPRHTVAITRGLWIQQTEMTRAGYRRFAQAANLPMASAPDYLTQDDTYPVVLVTWDEAVACCRWAGGRLPTEAEWEYAARAGATGRYYGKLPAVAWYWNNTHFSTQPVGLKPANAFGLHDVLGNVLEWVADRYAEGYYVSSEGRDPRGPSGGRYRVARGGSWVRSPPEVRLSVRWGFDPASRYADLGFRCVREAFP